MNLINQIPTAIAKGFLLCSLVGMLTGFLFLLQAISVNGFKLYIMDNPLSVQYFSDAIILIGASCWMLLIGLWIELKIIDKEGK
jgi:hypothetical protein